MMGKKSRRKMTGMTKEERIEASKVRRDKIGGIARLIEEKLKEPEARLELLRAVLEDIDHTDVEKVKKYIEVYESK